MENNAFEILDENKLIEDIRFVERSALNLIDSIIDEGKGDERWANMAKEDIQKGFMCLNKAVELAGWVL